MKLSIVAPLVFMGVVSPGVLAAAHEISWVPERELRLETPPDGARLHLAQGLAIEGERWPARVVRIEIPAGERVSDIRVTPIRERDLPESAAAGPAPRAAFESPGAPSVTSGYRFWVLPEGDYRGHRIAHILLVPFREAADGVPRFLERFRIDVRTEPADRAALARRVPHLRTDAEDRRALRALLDGEPLPDAPPPPAATLSIPPELSVETLEYVIITNAEMAPAFQEIADFKTRSGQPAAVTTVEWILASYDGIDLAARIRTYLRDLYLYQGLRFVLLGGDAEQVPTRYATSFYLSDAPRDVICDYYFACLDGDWNRDRDDRFGEAPDGDPGDDVDLFADVDVARVPASTAGEAASWVAKWKSYTGYDPAHFRTDYQAKFLALGEVLDPDDWTPEDPPSEIVFDGADICESTLAIVPPAVSRTKLYQYFENPDVPDALPELRDSVIAHINRGYGWIGHVGHGYRSNMSVGDGKILNRDADAFTNTDAYGVLYAVNCTSGAFVFDSIVEHLMLNPIGGIVGGVASTDIDYPAASEDFQWVFFKRLFEDDVTTLAAAFNSANAYFAPFAGLGDNSARWTILTSVAAGDPGMEMWRRAPRVFDLAHDATVPLGAGSFAVTVEGAFGTPVEGAVVCLHKSDGYGVGTTDASGVAVIDFLPETEGAFTITVTTNGYVPAVESATVTAPGTAALRVDGWVVHDGTGGGGSGNADSRPDAGESVVVDVTLRNDGSATATGVQAILHAGSPFLAVADSSESSANIAPASSRTLTGAFSFTVSAGLPDTLRHVVAPAVLELQSSQGTWVEPVPFGLYQRLIDLVALDWTIVDDDGDAVLEAGETASIDLTLMNRGEGNAPEVTAVGSLASSGFILVNDTIEFGDVGAGAQETAGSLSALSTGGGAGGLAIDVTVSDGYTPALLARSIDVVSPSPPDTFFFDATDREIRLVWVKPSPPDLRGYKVYRADAPEGPFQLLTDDIVEGGSFYTDEGLPELTFFHYRVASVDSSGNEGPPSAVVAASTAPPLLEGWPVDLPAGESKGSPTIADLDDDGRSEIVLGWSYPMVFRAHGGDFVDGDNDAVTNGIFADIAGGESQFWNSPAVTQLDRDALSELIFAAWQTTGEGALYVLDETGAVQPGWPRQIGQNPWSTAATGDVDGDGYPEIFLSSGAGTGAYKGALFGFRYDGDEIIDGDSNPATHGIFHRNPAPLARYMYGSPALADVDGDDLDEIVFLENSNQSATSLSTLYVFDDDGSVLPGFPYSDPDVRGSTSSPAVADLDGDGDLEIIAVTENRILIFNHDGSFFLGWPKPLPLVPSDATEVRDFLSSPAVGDVNGDGQLDVALGWLDGTVYLWTGLGGIVPPGFPVTLSVAGSPISAYARSPVLGNIDGDPFPEIIVSTDDARLFAVNHDGTQVPGFPIQIEGTTHGSVAVGDVDADGFVNLIVQTDAPVLRVFDFFDVPFDPLEQPWPMFRHDRQKSGCYRPAATVGAGADAPPPVAAVLSPRPNPFAPRVELPFVVPGDGARVRVRIFDVGGREVRRLADGRFPGGPHRISWDGRAQDGARLAPGVFFARVEIGEEPFVRKVTMLR